MRRLHSYIRRRLNVTVSAETTAARMWLLCGVSVVLGLVGGGAAIGLFKLIGLISHLTLLHNVGTSLPTLRHYHPTPWIIPTALIGAVIVSLFAWWSPVIRGHGIPESLEAILVRDSKIRPRAAVAKPLSAAVTIGTGGPFGAEGPIIVTAGSVGSLMGQLLSVSPTERKILLGVGAAAGMSATFNAPVASVILAVELVLFERSLRTIAPLSIACGVAAALHIVVFGPTPLFAMKTSLHPSLTHLPMFAVVGLVSGVLAVVLNKGLFALEAGFRKLPLNIFWWPVIGALCFSLIGLVQPRTLSMGYSAISDTLNGQFTLTAVALLFIAKLVSWWISLGSQTSGGTLAPMLLVGATMGAVLGHGIERAFPGLHISPAAVALVAMAATFGAATKALLTSVVFATEVTGEYGMVIALLVGVAFAELVAELALTDRIMTEKLSHRGFRVDFDVFTNFLRTRLACDVMRPPVTVPAGANASEVRQTLHSQGLDAVAVVDTKNRYVGLATVSSLDHDQVPDDDSTAGSLATDSLEPIPHGEYLSLALARLTGTEMDSLPVVDRGVVVGQLSRVDILAERYRYRKELQTRQPGWIQLLRSRRTNRVMPSSPPPMAYETLEQEVAADELLGSGPANPNGGSGAASPQDEA